MKTLIKKLASALCIFALFAALCTQFSAPAYAEYTLPDYIPNAVILSSVGDCITYPKNSSYLSQSEVKVVKAPKGVAVYFYTAPKAEKEYRRSFNIEDGAIVTVLAEQNGYAYVNASGRTGWCSARLLTSCTPLIASMPRMDSTHWVLVLSLRNSGLYEACFSGGSYVGYTASGCCVSGKYSLEGRRLTVDGIRFLWNGGEFVSTELQEMSGTWDHYKLIPGHTQFC